MFNPIIGIQELLQNRGLKRFESVNNVVGQKLLRQIHANQKYYRENLGTYSADKIQESGVFEKEVEGS